MASTSPVQGFFFLAVFGTLVTCSKILWDFLKTKMIITIILIIIGVVFPPLLALAMLIAMIYGFVTRLKMLVSNIPLVALGFASYILILFVPSVFRQSFLVSWLDSDFPVVVNILSFGLGVLLILGVFRLLRQKGYKHPALCLYMIGLPGILILVIFGGHFGPGLDFDAGDNI